MKLFADVVDKIDEERPEDYPVMKILAVAELRQFSVQPERIVPLAAYRAAAQPVPQVRHGSD